MTALALLGATRVAAPALVSPVLVRPFRSTWTKVADALTHRVAARPVDAATPMGERVIGEWIGAPVLPDAPVVFYLHGGGYSLCSPSTHRHLVASLAEAVGGSAFALRYRMAPRFRFPAANEDALRAYRWLLDQGISAANIAVVGDSAGGHLALGLLGDLREAGLPMPGSVVALSPIVDGTMAIARACRVVDPMFPRSTAYDVMSRYFDGSDSTDHRVDVCRVAGPDLPPILIHAGGREMFVDDALAFTRAMEDAGQPCELHVWPGQVHAFQVLHPFIPEGRAAVREAADFIRFKRTSRSDRRTQLSQEGNIP
ncbi:MAG: alpha/beta hydrolase [Propionibacteriales bacterium]|nr:alpha/beta hydrolase [Propionibacteriales bacterium]